MRDSRRWNPPHKVRDALRESRPDPGSSEQDQSRRARTPPDAMAAIRDASFAISAQLRMMGRQREQGKEGRRAPGRSFRVREESRAVDDLDGESQGRDESAKRGVSQAFGAFRSGSGFNGG